MKHKISSLLSATVLTGMVASSALAAKAEKPVCPKPKPRFPTKSFPTKAFPTKALQNGLSFQLQESENELDQCLQLFVQQSQSGEVAPVSSEDMALAEDCMAAFEQGLFQ